MKYHLIIFSIIILLFSGCTSGKSARIRKMPVEQKMQIGNRYFDEEKYSRAVPYFFEVTLERRTAFTAEAQIKLAESYFRMGRYNDAIYEYREMISLFPDYPDIDLAYFNLAMSYYHLSLGPHYCQRETYQALEAFDVFLDRFAVSNKRNEAFIYINELHYKLLQKKFYNGYIYYKTYDYSAALMYFNEILELGNRDELEEKSLYYSGLIYLARRDYDSLRDVKDMMIEYYPESSNTRRIRRSYQRAF